MNYEDCHHMRDVLDEVANERKRQEEKWGQQNHAPVYYNAILQEEVGEVAKEVVEYTFAEPGVPRLQNIRKELVQVAAVAVAMIQSLDRNELRSK
ncbi:MazG-like family protein [Larkinella harenae]